MLVTTCLAPLSALTVLKAASLPPKPKQAPAGRFIHSGACSSGDPSAALHSRQSQAQIAGRLNHTAPTASAWR